MSIEALALLPWYAELFDDEVQAKARRKLADYGFDIDTFVDCRTATPPEWTSHASVRTRPGGR